MQICRLCLKTANDVIHIFGTAGVDLNVSTVLSKYFWFEPKSDDPISTEVCSGCWRRVSDFHEFYCSVEKAHRLLTERFSLKGGEQQTQAEVAEEQSKLREEEEQQNDLLSIAEADLQLEDVADTQGSFADSDSAGETFSNEQFLNEVLQQQQQQQEQQSEEELDVKPPANLLLELADRRQTRSTRAKSKVIPLPASESLPKPTKRRGRPKSVKASPGHKRYEDYKKTMQDIDRRIAQHMRLTCSVCHEDSETFLLLCKHMQQVHHLKGYAVCCNKKFYKRSFLTDHIERHTNPEKFKCQLCGKSFADKQCLRNHEHLMHKPEEEKIYMCENCPKKYTKKYLLDQHRIIHKERILPCNLCNRRFPNMSTLSGHVKLVHSNTGTMCDICAQVIRGHTAFQRHQLEHQGITEPRMQCDICGSWHKNKYSLKKHVSRHHEQTEESTCNICGKVSPNRTAMLSHQRYVHTADRVHGCSVCSKKFKKAINLKEHMATHTGEVLYKCPHCPKTFNSNANQHSHRKKCHPKEFEEARRARLQKRMAPGGKDKEQQQQDEEQSPPAKDKSSMITITTPADTEGSMETHNILVTTSVLPSDDEGAGPCFKSENIEFTITLSSEDMT